MYRGLSETSASSKLGRSVWWWRLHDPRSRGAGTTFACGANGATYRKKFELGRRGPWGALSRARRGRAPRQRALGQHDADLHVGQRCRGGGCYKLTPYEKSSTVPSRPPRGTNAGAGAGASTSTSHRRSPTPWASDSTAWGRSNGVSLVPDADRRGSIGSIVPVLLEHLNYPREGGRPEAYCGLRTAEWRPTSVHGGGRGALPLGERPAYELTNVTGVTPPSTPAPASDPSSRRQAPSRGPAGDGRPAHPPRVASSFAALALVAGVAAGSGIGPSTAASAAW